MPIPPLPVHPRPKATMHALVFLDLQVSPPAVSRVLLASSRHVTMDHGREAAAELCSASGDSIRDAHAKLLRALAQPPYAWVLPFLSTSDRDPDYLIGAHLRGAEPEDFTATVDHRNFMGNRARITVDVRGGARGGLRLILTIARADVGGAMYDDVVRNLELGDLVKVHGVLAGDTCRVMRIARTSEPSLADPPPTTPTRPFRQPFHGPGGE